MTDYIESLKWRYATKKYDAGKKVPAQDIEQLKEAVSLSVSSVGLQPYKVIIVQDEAVKAKLAQAASGNNVNLINDASHLFVFANDVNVGDAQVEQYIDTIASVRDVSREALEGFGTYIKNYVASLSNEEKSAWTAKQAYIALSTLINSAAILKIDTTPMEGFDPKKFNEILGINEKGLNTAVIATIGYRHADDTNQHLKKVRKPNNELFLTL